MHIVTHNTACCTARFLDTSTLGRSSNAFLRLALHAYLTKIDAWVNRPLLFRTPHLNLTAITSDIHRLVIHLYVCVTKGSTVDSLNGSWRYQKVMFHITAVSFTERWTRLQNTITKPILSEVLVPLEQQFRLTDFPLLRVYCICEIIPC